MDENIECPNELFDGVVERLRTLAPSQLIEECDRLAIARFVSDPAGAALLTLFKETLTLICTAEGRALVALEHKASNRFYEMTSSRAGVDSVFDILQGLLKNQTRTDNDNR